MITFRTPGAIGERELRAMTMAEVYARRNHTTELPACLVTELRILGITVESLWPGPSEPPRRVPVAGTVA